MKKILTVFVLVLVMGMGFSSIVQANTIKSNIPTIPDFIKKGSAKYKETVTEEELAQIQQDVKDLLEILPLDITDGFYEFLWMAMDIMTFSYYIFGHNGLGKIMGCAMILVLLWLPIRIKCWEYCFFEIGEKAKYISWEDLVHDYGIVGAILYFIIFVCQLPFNYLFLFFKVRLYHMQVHWMLEDYAMSYAP